MLTYKVPDMSCGHCVATVEKTVKEVDPTAGVRADLASKTVAIDSALSPASFAAALSEAGYPVSAA